MSEHLLYWMDGEDHSKNAVRGLLLGIQVSMPAYVRPGPGICQWYLDGTMQYSSHQENTDLAVPPSVEWSHRTDPPDSDENDRETGP